MIAWIQKEILVQMYTGDKRLRLFTTIQYKAETEAHWILAAINDEMDLVQFSELSNGNIKLW